MTTSIIKKYHIHQGPNYHSWLTSDPPYPRSRYKLLRTVIVNDQIMEEPSMQERTHLIEEYSDFDAANNRVKELNAKWLAEDPNLDFYRSRGFKD